MKPYCTNESSEKWMIQPIWKCRTFCLDKKPASCHQYWVVFLWKLLHPDYCSRCLELPEKRFCLTKMRILNQSTYFNMTFFSPYASVRDENVTSWCHLKCIIQFSIIDIVFLWRPQTWTKWTKWSFVLRLDLQFKTSGLVFVVWFLNGHIQKAVFCPLETEISRKKILWWLLQCKVGVVLNFSLVALVSVVLSNKTLFTFISAGITDSCSEGY